MSKDKKEEKPSFLKRIFRGESLDGVVEVGRVKPLTETDDLEEKRKKLLERVNRVEREIKEERRSNVITV